MAHIAHSSRNASFHGSHYTVTVVLNTRLSHQRTLNRQPLVSSILLVYRNACQPHQMLVTASSNMKWTLVSVDPIFSFHALHLWFRRPFNTSILPFQLSGIALHNYSFCRLSGVLYLSAMESQCLLFRSLFCCAIESSTFLSFTIKVIHGRIPYCFLFQPLV